MRKTKTELPQWVDDAVSEIPPDALPEPGIPPALPVPRVHDYVSIYGPRGVRLPGVVREVRDGDPPRCLLQGFATNGLTQLANIPVRPVVGEDWWCELVARFEVG